MGLDPWQIDKIRARLMSYTEDKGRPPNLLPLATVRERMRECPAVDDSLFDPEGKRQFRYEALRRFYQGTENPLDFKIEAVRDFLIFEGFLSKEELTDEGGDFGELLALHGYLANMSESARKRAEHLIDGRYVQASTTTASSLDIELHFTRDLSRVMMRVEEHHSYPEPDRAGRKNIDARPSRAIRKGFGFFSTKQCLLHIFLRGRTGQDRVHYVEFAASYSDAAPYLIRIGGTSNEAVKGSEVFRDPRAMASCEIHRYKHEGSEITSKPPETPRELASSIPGMPDMEQAVTYDSVSATGAESPLNLIALIEQDSAGILRMLLEEGADPNRQDDEGMTVLHHAAGLGNRACIRALVGAGTCDYLISDHYGRYASDLAIEWARDFGVARLLSKKRRQQALLRGVAAYVAPLKCLKNQKKEAP